MENNLSTDDKIRATKLKVLQNYLRNLSQRSKKSRQFGKW